MRTAPEGEGAGGAGPEPRSRTGDDPVRVLVSLGTDTGRPDVDSALARIDAAWRHGAPIIVLAAPGLMERSDFGAVVAHIVSRGLGLGLVIDGERLEEPGLVERLVERANLRYVHLRAPASPRTRAVMRALRERGVHTVLSSDIGEGDDPFETGDDGSWPHQLALVWGARGDEEAIADPREAAQRARERLLAAPFGPAVWILGLPVCTWPEDRGEGFVSGAHPLLGEALAADGSHEDARERILPPACAGCAHDRDCVGVSVSWMASGSEGILQAVRMEPDAPRASRLAGEPNWGDGFRPTERPRVDIAPRYPDTVLATLIVPGCDLGCVFCDTPQLGMPIRFSTPGLVRACLRALRPRTTGVFFTGGEPTQLSWLPDLLAEAQDLGFQRIQMQSHAGRASDPDLARSLIDAGLTAIDVPLYGHTAQIHEVVTRTPQSFQRTLDGLHNLRSLGARSVVHVTLFRSNLPHLAELLRFIDELGPDEAYLQVTGETGPPGFFAGAAPRPREVGEACQEAFAAYTPHTRVRLADVAPCLVPDLEDRVLRWRGEVELEAPAVALPYSEWLKVFSAGATRGYGDRCTDCASRERCDGLPREVLQLHGEQDLRPR